LVGKALGRKYCPILVPGIYWAGLGYLRPSPGAQDYYFFSNIHTMSRIYEAIRKAQEARSNNERASGGDLAVMELPDRRSGPRSDFPILHRTSGEAPVEFAASAAVNLDPAVMDDTFLAPPRPEFAEEVDPSLPSGGSIMGSNTSPVKQAVEALEMAFSNIIHECVEETATLQRQEVMGRVGMAPTFFPGRDALGTGTFPMLETSPAAEHGSSPVAGANGQLQPSGFLAFYGLNQQPFDVTPDPDYLYLSRSHREALTSLSQGIENLRGFVTLVANPGLGKTTLLNKLTEELGERARVVHLFQTQCNSTELLGYLLSELGVDYDSTDVVAMHRKLNQVLFREMLAGRRFVLIVDEAQNLQESVLETIRLLSDFETTHSKLIQIVLAGQPQLVQTLMRPGLSQLRQRIGMVANLKPLDAAEVAEYVEHRLRTAGFRGKSVFNRDALNLIAEQSGGAPRSINNLCFNALLLGYSMRQEIIDAGIVERASKKMDLAQFAVSS
jgi:type II secretory pathway predicted ATPase ExeA